MIDPRASLRSPFLGAVDKTLQTRSRTLVCDSGICTLIKNWRCKTGNEAAIHLQKILTAVVVQWNVCCCLLHCQSVFDNAGIYTFISYIVKQFCVAETSTCKQFVK